MIRIATGTIRNAVAPGVRHGFLANFSKTPWRLALLLAFAISPVGAANSPQEEVTRDFQKTVTLPAGQSVSVDHRFGSVRLHGETGRDVKISATIKVQAGSRADAQAFADKIQIEVEQNASGVHIRTVYPEKSWFSFNQRSSYSVNYEISMPSDAPLRVKNDFGGVEAAGIHGNAEIENGHGSITARDLGSARLNNSFGSIELQGAGGNVSIVDSNGSVQASDVNGTLEVRDRFGSVEAHNVKGATTITNGNGNVSLTNAAAANITTSFGGIEARNISGELIVHNNNGNVDFSTIGGSADITDSFGNVTFSDVRGRMNCVTTNGRVTGSSVSGDAVTIRDSFGNIELKNIAGSLDAEDSNGGIKVTDARGAVTLKSSFGTVDASNIPKGIRAVNGNGAIKLTDIGGDAYAKTSFGGITVERINGNFTAENTNGAVTARTVKGDANVHTTFAGVELEGIGGRISVDNQNGGISVAALRPASGCRDISLKTTFSAIRVHIPEGVGYNVAARTSFGRISSELPVTASGSMGNDNLNGTIGAGGCQLQLTDSNGSIEISKTP